MIYEITYRSFCSNCGETQVWLESFSGLSASPLILRDLAKSRPLVSCSQQNQTGCYPPGGIALS
jgi:hypothetical protein